MRMGTRIGTGGPHELAGIARETLARLWRGMRASSGHFCDSSSLVRGKFSRFLACDRDAFPLLLFSPRSIRVVLSFLLAFGIARFLHDTIQRETHDFIVLQLCLITRI